MVSNSVAIRRCTSHEVAIIESREPPGAGVARSLFTAQQAGRGLYLVAWEDDIPVGGGYLEWTQPPELKNLQVDEPRRGRGIGNAIIVAAEREARQDGALEIGVGVDNFDARRLYERLGYLPTGRRETYTYEYVDADGTRQKETETAVYLRKVLTSS